jgi:hypothetical protein
MRALVFTASFIVLLLTGFLATPGVFDFINPEHLLAVRQYSAPLDQLKRDILDTNNQIIQIDLQIASLEKTLAELITESRAKQVTMGLEGATPIAIALAATEFGKKSEGVEGDLKQSRSKKAGLEAQRKNFKVSQDEMTKKIEASGAESANLYIVTRALALGAIGALMSIFASLLSISKARAAFDDKDSLTKIWASMAIGAIVSVVVVGLFFTGFISIFAQPEHVAGNPTAVTGNPTQIPKTDFWKVTILCLLAGAFSDRLFQAASGRMERYLGSDESGKVAASRRGEVATLSQAPSRKKRPRSRKVASSQK